MKESHSEPNQVIIARETHEPSKITTFTISITANAPYKKILKNAKKVFDEHK